MSVLELLPRALPELWDARNTDVGLLDAGGSQHIVQFYESDSFLLDEVSAFIARALRAGDAGIVVATPAHRQGIAQRLTAGGIDVAAAVAQGRYQALDAAETLGQFMYGEVPDEARFGEVVGERLAQAARGGRRVHVF